MGGGKAAEAVAGRRAAEAFCKSLERSCGGEGYIDVSLAMRVWPLLTHHVEGAQIRKMKQQLQKQGAPICCQEWLALMDVVCNIGGIRLFTGAVLNAWVMLEEGRLKVDNTSSRSCTSSASTTTKSRSSCASAMRGSRRRHSKSQRDPHGASPTGGQHSCLQTPSDQVPGSAEVSTWSQSCQKDEVPCAGPCGTCDGPPTTPLPPMSTVTSFEEEPWTSKTGCKEQETDVLCSTADVITADKQCEDLHCESMHGTPICGAAERHSCSSDVECSEERCSPGIMSQSPTADPSSSPTCSAATVTSACPATSRLVSRQDEETMPEIPHGQVGVRPPSSAAGVAEALQVTTGPHGLEVQSGAAIEKVVQGAAAEDVPDLSAEEEGMPKAGEPEVEASQCRQDDTLSASASTQLAVNDAQARAGTLKRKPTSKGPCMKRSTSQPSPALPKLATLPPLPKVPTAVPSAVRLATSISTWKSQHFTYHRVGNVVQLNKDLPGLGGGLRLGQRGRLVKIIPEVSVEILIDGKTVSVPRSDLLHHFDLCVVTHEVEQIDTQGEPSGKSLACMILKDHEDGLLDILCQDGREAHLVHASFVKELPQGMYMDVGYLSSQAGTASSPSSPSSCSCSADRAPKGLQLPPAGFIGNRKAAALASAATSTISKSRSHSRREDGVATLTNLFLPEQQASSSSSAIADSPDVVHPGACVCPFMEIQEGGLRAFAGLSHFSVSDTVVDIGCGHGKILAKILERCPCNGIGVEVNPMIAKVAARQLLRFSNRVKVVADDIRNVDLQTATVTVSYLLSHSFDANKGALKEHLSKSLKPGSIVLNYTYPIPGWIGCKLNGIHKYTIGEHLKE